MNRRTPRLRRPLGGIVAALWRFRRLMLLVIPYILVFSWLFWDGEPERLRSEEAPASREAPRWRPPDSIHWFGTGIDGSDVFEVSRRAVAHSIAVSVVATSLGMGMALLAVLLFAFENRETRFEALERVGRVAVTVPTMVFLVIFAGGAGGGLGVVIAGLAAATALHLAPVLARWFQEGEAGFHLEALRVLGLSRREILRSRVFPSILRRFPALFARIVPLVALAEMSLSFLGFSVHKPGLGRMVAEGREFLLEAPWLALCPGLLATAVIAVLSLLGWRVSLALRTGPTPPFL